MLSLTLSLHDGKTYKTCEKKDNINEPQLSTKHNIDTVTKPCSTHSMDEEGLLPVQFCVKSKKMICREM